MCRNVQITNTIIYFFRYNRLNALLTVAGANGPNMALALFRVLMESEGEPDNATSPHPRTEGNNAKATVSQ